MISEKRFSTSFTSFWQELLPSGEAVLRKINLERKRYCPPLTSKVNASRRDLVSEIGFLLYKASVIEKKPPKQIFDSKGEFDPICDQAVKTIERFRGSIAPPNKPEQMEAFSITTNLSQFFELHGTIEIIVSPKFVGCGFVDTCVSQPDRIL